MNIVYTYISLSLYIYIYIYIISLSTYLSIYLSLSIYMYMCMCVYIYAPFSHAYIIQTITQDEFNTLNILSARYQLERVSRVNNYLMQQFGSLKAVNR